MKTYRSWSALWLLKWIILLTGALVVVKADGELSTGGGGGGGGGRSEETVPCLRRPEDGSWECDCARKQWSMVLPLMPNHVEHIRIRRCLRLRVPGDTFSQAEIVRSVVVSDIDRLELENGSFQFRARNTERSILLSFFNVNIPNFASHSVHGNLDELQLDNCTIGRMHAFAVMPTRTMQILSIQRTTIHQTDRHVFKKFSVAFFTWRNNDFRSVVPSTMVRDVAVTERLVIADTNFSIILPNAFQFDDVNSFEFNKNIVEVMNGSSFHMRVANSVRVMGNVIGELSSTAFLAIKSTYPTRPQENLHFQQPEFIFAENRVDISDHPFRLRFDTDSFSVVISKLNVITPISCDVIVDRLGDNNEFLRTFGDSIYFRLSADDEDYRSLVAYSFLVDRKCVADNTVLIIIGSTSIVVLVVLIALAVVWWLCRRRRLAIERMTVVQPEPKTYRETQIVIQIENAGLLKTDL